MLGSFPCFNGSDYGDWFYSGSGRNEFWPLLSKVYNAPATTREHKEMLCQAHGIAITDIALKIQRTKGNCSDTNLNILEINKAGIYQCLSAGVKLILFTSKFVEKLFQKHFPEVKLPTYALLSPSPAVNQYLPAREKYKKLLAEGKITSAFEYKLLQYRLVFTDKTI